MSSQGFIKKKSILFLDDESEVLDNYKEFFEDEDGLLVITTSSAREALTKIRNQRFDVICTDYRMPDMGGFDFMTEVRKVPGYDKMPFVVITGFVEEAISRCEGLPNIMFLSKPVNLESVAKLALFIAKTGKLPAIGA